MATVSKDTFPEIYWGNDSSTRVRFTPLTEVPPGTVTSCFVVAITPNGHIAISRPERGWGLPGGHVEAGESPEDCVRREANEECGITLGKLTVIGGWLAEKVKETEYNAKYPKRAYQLMYLAQIEAISDNYTPQHEILERKFIPIEDFPKYHHSFDSYESIYNYILRTIEGEDWFQS